MPRVIEHAARELLCARHLVTSAQLQDLGLLGVAYFIKLDLSWSWDITFILPNLEYI